jgi:hypothetical protein
MTPTIMKPKMATAAKVWNTVTVSTTSDMTASFLIALTVLANNSIAWGAIA